jgi:hypothetical protein
MKKTLLLLITVVAFARGRAQTPAEPNPQFMNTVYYWAADTLQALEKTNGELKNKFRIYGAGGASYVLEGPRSLMRIKAGANTRFAVKLSGMMDPSQLIKLYRFDSQKKNREAPVSQGNKNVIDCNVQKSGADVFVLIPASSLPPGEYAFQNVMMMNGAGSTHMSYTFFAFGVDP